MANTHSHGALGTHRLRVAMVWNGTVQAEELLLDAAPVRVGSAKGCLFPLPDEIVVPPSRSPVQAPAALLLLEPSGSGSAGGYRLHVSPEMAGEVWIGGERRSVQSLAALSPVELSPTDFGVVSVGSVSFFFQQVRAPGRLPRPFFTLDGPATASIGLAAFLATAFLLFLFLIVKKEMPEPDPFEMSTDLVARFMVTPPPESILEEMKKESGTNTKDPGKRDRDEGGKKAAKDEGRVGKQDAKQEDTEIAGERTEAVAARVRNMGLLGALAGGGQKNAIADALDVPDVSDVLGGLGSAQTIMGRGAGGAGLRGTGAGGGGDGQGSLFGAGAVGTGIGAGSGSGLGKGSGGIGAKGRERKERAISVTTGTPKVNGYLSPEQINRVVRANQAQIRYCYENEVQRQPSLKGRVEVQWRINLQGAVITAKVASSTLRNAKVEGCMVRQVRNWKFPKPDGGEVVVTYPFIFGVQG
jgi:hypothetical protein